MRKYIETLYQKNGDPYPTYNPRSKSAGLKKSAAKKSEAMIFADTVEKEHPENEVIVVIGVTGVEYYGSNDNGDGFPTVATPHIPEADLLQNHYKSFEKGAKVYYQHDVSSPPIGKILKAFWNEARKWVELVLELFHDAPDKDALERARTGEMLGVSMGCDVSGDICSICYNRAPTLDKHCTHIKNDLHKMIEGKVVMMLCPSPSFFDMSVVTVPADAITNSVYRKVAKLSAPGELSSHERSAKLGELLKMSANVKAAVQKINSMYKGIENNDIMLNKALKPVLAEPFSVVKDIAGETLFDEVLFFTKMGLPYSLNKLSEKANIPKEEIMKEQEELMDKIKTDSEYRKLVEHIADRFISDTRKPHVPDEFLKLLCKSDTLEDKGPITVEVSPVSLALFNIINKLSILDKSNFVKSTLAGTDVKNDDMEELIMLEHLLY